MGQQQLLLLVLSVVLVGLAVVSGMQVFEEQKRKNANENLVYELRMLMEEVRAWRAKPAAFGGPHSTYTYSSFRFYDLGYDEARVYDGGSYPGTCMMLPSGGDVFVHRGYDHSEGQAYLTFLAYHSEYGFRYRARVRTNPDTVLVEPYMDRTDTFSSGACTD